MYSRVPAAFSAAFGARLAALHGPGGAMPCTVSGDFRVLGWQDGSASTEEDIDMQKHGI